LRQGGRSGARNCVPHFHRPPVPFGPPTRPPQASRAKALRLKAEPLDLAHGHMESIDLGGNAAETVLACFQPKGQDRELRDSPRNFPFNPPLRGYVLPPGPSRRTPFRTITYKHVDAQPKISCSPALYPGNLPSESLSGYYLSSRYLIRAFGRVTEAAQPGSRVST